MAWALKLVVAIGGGAIMAALALSAQKREPGPAVIPPEGGAVGRGTNGVVARFKVGSVSTGSSQLSVATGVVPPGASVPMHLHEIDEEVLYVLEGRVTVTLAGKEYEAGPGTTVFIPPKTWMRYENRSNAPVQLLGVLPRGELEECFRAMYPTADQPGRSEHAGPDHAKAMQKLCGTRLAQPADAR